MAKNNSPLPTVGGENKNISAENRDSYEKLPGSIGFKIFDNLFFISEWVLRKSTMFKAVDNWHVENETYLGSLIIIIRNLNSQIETVKTSSIQRQKIHLRN